MAPLTQADRAYIASLDSRRRTANRVYRTADPGVANRVARLAKAYPGMSPGLAYSLGASGFSISGVAERAWQAELATRLIRAGQKEQARQSQGGGGGILSTIVDIVKKPVELYEELTEETRQVGERIDPSLRRAAQVQRGERKAQFPELVRYPAAVAQAGYEVVGGVLRQVPLAFQDPEETRKKYPGGAGEVVSSLGAQTTLGQHISTGASMGEGLLPDYRSPAALQQAEAARKYSPYLIGGHAWTPGRALADTVFEPDDGAFKIASGLIDAGAALTLDPANYLASLSTMYRQARKAVVPDEMFPLYEEGLLKVNRAGFLPTKWSEAASRAPAQATFAAIADVDDAFDLVKAGIPARVEAPGGVRYLAAEAAAEKNPAKIEQMFRDTLINFPKGIDYTLPSYSFSRWKTDIPSIGKPIVFGPNTDIDETFGQIDRILVNSGASVEERRHVGNLVARMGNDAEKHEDVIQALTDTLQTVYTRQGVSTKFMDETREAFGRELAIDREISTQTTGDLRLFSPVDVQTGMTAHRIADSVLEDQLFHNVFYMPNPRHARAEVSKLSYIWTHPAYKGAADLTDMAMSLWRSSVLSRPATGLRVTGEEQLRIAAYGLASIGSHPFRALALIVGNEDSRWIRKWQNMPITKPMGDAMEWFKNKYGVTPSKMFIQGEMPGRFPLHDALHQRFSGVTGSQHNLLGGFTTIDPTVTTGAGAAENLRLAGQGLGFQLMQVREDALLRSILTTDNIADVKAAFRNGTGDLEGYRAHIGTRRGQEAVAFDDAAADVFVDDWARIINDATGGNPELIEAVKTGYIRGVRIAGPTGEITSRAAKRFNQILEEGRQSGQSRFALTLPGGEKRGREAADAASSVPAVRKLNQPPRPRGATPPAVPTARGAGGVVQGQEAEAIIERLVRAHDRATVRKIMGYNTSPDVAGRLVKARNRDSVLGILEQHGMVTPMAPQYTQIPKSIILPAEAKLTSSQRAAGLRVLDNIFNYTLDLFLTRPSNYFSRNLMVQQSYLNEIERTFAWVDGPGRKEIMRRMGRDFTLPDGTTVKGANLPKNIQEKFRRMDQRIGEINLKAGRSYLDTGTLTAEQASRIAAFRAIRETRDLLYDLSKRNQSMDMLRVLMPFGEAFKEVITRWIKLTWENPRVLRRLEQGLQAARAPGSSSIYDISGMAEHPVDVLDPGKGTQGFFYKDSFDNEVFAYPGSNLINEKLWGVNIPLTGGVQGLNLVGNGVPGIGPMIQMPLAYLLPDKPEFDDVRDLLFPYGKPDLIDLAPGWLGKVGQALKNPETDRLFASTVMDAARYLNSKGTYDLQGQNAQEEMNRLYSDAKKAARAIYITRAFGQFTLPASPQTEWLAYDKQGRLTLQWAMTKFYNKMVEDLGYEEGFAKFVDVFGTKNILAPQPKSVPTIPAGPISADQYTWARKNPGVREDYPKTYGLFAPPDDEEMDSEAYEAAFERGERIGLKPQQMFRLANDRLAKLAYDNIRARAGEKITQQEEIALRQLRTRLTAWFPGYQDKPVDFTRKEVLVEELKRAVKDPRLRRNPAMAGLKAYLHQRELAYAAVTQGGVTFKAKAATSISRRLWQYGEGLADQNPAFQQMWDTVFKGELRQPEDW